MNIHNLKCFVYVGECLNFSLAAKRLFITQPNLSQIISSLEKQIGAKLFIRSTKFVKLTQAGELLMPVAIEIVEKYEKIVNEINKFSSADKETLKIGYLGTAFNRILPQCIPVFQNENPNAKITLQRIDPNNFRDVFDNDLIDIGFAHLVDVENIASLHYKKLFDVYLTFVVHKDHPFGNLESVDLESLKNEPLILPFESFSPYLRRRILDVCAQKGFSPTISQEAHGVDVLYQMIDSKMGVAILPESGRCLNYRNLRFIKIHDGGDELDVGACLVWKNKPKQIAVKLLDLIEDTVGSTIGSLFDPNP